MRLLTAVVLAGLLLTSASFATTIMPLDRATILAGPPFDMKVELNSLVRVLADTFALAPATN
jgi:alkaline phosphatase